MSGSYSRNEANAHRARTAWAIDLWSFPNDQALYCWGDLWICMAGERVSDGPDHWTTLLKIGPRFRHGRGSIESGTLSIQDGIKHTQSAITDIGKPLSSLLSIGWSHKQTVAWVLLYDGRRITARTTTKHCTKPSRLGGHWAALLNSQLCRVPYQGSSAKYCWSLHFFLSWTILCTFKCLNDPIDVVPTLGKFDSKLHRKNSLYHL